MKALQRLIMFSSSWLTMPETHFWLLQAWTFETWMLEQDYFLYWPLPIFYLRHCRFVDPNWRVQRVPWHAAEQEQCDIIQYGHNRFPQDLGVRGMETGCPRGTGVQLYRINSSWCWVPSHTNILTWFWNVWSEFVKKVEFLFCVFSHVRSGIYPAPAATTSATLFILSIYSRQILDKSSVCHREGSTVLGYCFCPPLTGKDTEAIV